MKVKSESEVAQSCPTLSDPMDCSLPGSSVHGIFQARVLECGATGLPIHHQCPEFTQTHVQNIETEDFTCDILLSNSFSKIDILLELQQCPDHFTVTECFFIFFWLSL